MMHGERGQRLTQHPRMHPPAGCSSWIACAARCASALFSIDRKAGRARARHPRQPRAVGGTQRRQHFADHRLDAHRRGFEIVGCRQRALRSTSSSDAPASRPGRSPRITSVAPTSNSPLRRPSAANTSLVATGTRGLTSTHGIFGKLQRQQRFADAGHDAGARGEAHRHVGAGQLRDLDQARIVERKAVGPRQQPQRRGGIRRAAADAGRDRQTLSSMNSPSLRSGTRSPSSCAALSTRLSEVSPQSPRAAARWS